MILSWLALQPWSGGCSLIRRWREIDALDPVGVAAAMASGSTFGDCHIADLGYFCLRMDPDPSLEPVNGSGIERYDTIVRTLRGVRADVLAIGPALRAAGVLVPDLQFDSAEVKGWMMKERVASRLACRPPPSTGVRKHAPSEFAKRLGLDDM